MPAVEKYFFTPLYFPRSRWAVVRWWEARRGLYNVVVGSAGAVSMGAMTLFAMLPPRMLPPEVDWGPVAVGVASYGLLANLCYSLGPFADIALRRLLGDRAAAAGPVLLRYGFVFSIGLTLMPIPLAFIGWLFRAVL